MPMMTALVLIPIDDDGLLGKLRDLRYRSLTGLWKQCRELNKERPRAFVLDEDALKAIAEYGSARATEYRNGREYVRTINIDSHNRYVCAQLED